MRFLDVSLVVLTCLATGACASDPEDAAAANATAAPTAGSAASGPEAADWTIAAVVPEDPDPAGFDALEPIEVALDRSEPPGSGVWINATELGANQVDELTALYGVRALPGKYWYDAKSGLYGVEGYPAFGFMYPNHDFGKLAEDASRGATGVVVNGRELPLTEWQVWSSILGTPILPGRYWFDSMGNAGYEGSPIPVVNYFVAAQRNAYVGGGTAGAGGGDNFWSSRFSAGNSDQGGSRGYVSVPGYGPVGYGF